MMEGRWPREATYEMHVSAETIQLGEAKGWIETNVLRDVYNAAR